MMLSADDPSASLQLKLPGPPGTPAAAEAAALAGEAWPYTGAPWVQDVSSERWRALNATASVARFSALPLRKRHRVLASEKVRRFALHREPIDRALSGFHSKVACGSGDAVDHAGAIRQLMRQAPAAAARLGPGSNVSAAVPCLSAGDWARLLLEAAGGPNRWSINPQCAAAHTNAHHRLTRPFAAPLTTRHPLPRAASWRSPTRAATPRSGTTG